MALLFGIALRAYSSKNGACPQKHKSPLTTLNKQLAVGLGEVACLARLCLVLLRGAIGAGKRDLSVISATSLPQPTDGFTFTITHFLESARFAGCLVRLFLHANPFRFGVNAECFPTHLKASHPKNEDCLVRGFGVSESACRCSW